MVVTMNPFMTEQRGFIMKESSCAESATQFFVCEQTNRINGRRTTTTMQGNSTGVSRCSASFAWWERHFVLLTRTESSRDHDCRLSPSVSLL